MAAGLISKEDFLQKALDICSRSQILEDGWVIEKIGDDRVLCKTVTQQIPYSKRSHQTQELQEGKCSNSEDLIQDDVDSALEDIDAACLTVNTTDLSETLKFDYHVVYSESYSVPVLYVNVTKSDGQLVSLTELWDMIPPAYKERLEADKWTFFTQQEHPLLGRPFYQLHPCHTEKLMSSVRGPDENRDDKDRLELI